MTFWENIEIEPFGQSFGCKMVGLNQLKTKLRRKWIKRKKRRWRRRKRRRRRKKAEIICVFNFKQNKWGRIATIARAFFN